MNKKIQADGFVMDQKLEEFINAKLDKLPTFYDKIISTDVKLRLDSHQKVKDKIIHILCHIPHADLFVEATAKSFEIATDEAIDNLIIQIKRKKELQLEKGQGAKALLSQIEEYDLED